MHQLMEYNEHNSFFVSCLDKRAQTVSKSALVARKNVTQIEETKAREKNNNNNNGDDNGDDGKKKRQQNK